MAEYTQQLESVIERLDELNGYASSIDETIQSFSGASGVVVDDSSVINKLDDLINAIGAAQPVPLDYTAKLQQVNELLVYTDLLLLVLMVFAVLGVGFVVGASLTGRLKLGG